MKVSLSKTSCEGVLCMVVCAKDLMLNTVDEIIPSMGLHFLLYLVYANGMYYVIYYLVYTFKYCICLRVSDDYRITCNSAITFYHTFEFC